MAGLASGTGSMAQTTNLTNPPHTGDILHFAMLCHAIFTTNGLSYFHLRLRFRLRHFRLMSGKAAREHFPDVKQEWFMIRLLQHLDLKIFNTTALWCNKYLLSRIPCFSIFPPTRLAKVKKKIIQCSGSWLPLDRGLPSEIAPILTTG